MYCSEIMRHEFPWVSPDSTVERAAKLMAHRNLGFLPVCDGDARPLGVLTDRDITLRVIAEDRQPAKTRVDEVMTAPVQFVAPDTALERVGEIMAKQAVSRLLVLDEDGQLDGVVSLADLLISAPADAALATARGVCTWEIGERSVDHPAPVPAGFEEDSQLASGTTSAPDPAQANPARAEAERVISGGDNQLKEFPG